MDPVIRSKYVCKIFHHLCSSNHVDISKKFNREKFCLLDLRTPEKDFLFVSRLCLEYIYNTPQLAKRPTWKICFKHVACFFLARLVCFTAFATPYQQFAFKTQIFITVFEQLRFASFSCRTFQILYILNPSTKFASKPLRMARNTQKCPIKMLDDASKQKNEK
jgi:hypothetical protein